MDLIVVYAAVFIAGLILFDSVIRSVFSATSRSKSMNYRLRMLERNENDNLQTYRSMIRERGLGYDRDANAAIVFFRRLFSQSGLKLSAAKAVAYVVVVFLLSWLATGIIMSHTLLRLLFALLAVIVVTYFVLARARSRRMARFIEQLPGAIDVVNRSLLSGHPLPTAISLVSRELPDPVGSEFGILSDELTYGTEIDDAMLNMVERVGAEDLKLLAVSMSVQRGTGGNFAEILENLSTVIRDRAMLRAKVRALSAEGRITAIVMSAFPFLLYLIISTLSPTYFDPIWDSGYAPHIIATAIVIMLIGNFILYRLVHFDF